MSSMCDFYCYAQMTLANGLEFDSTSIVSLVVNNSDFVVTNSGNKAACQFEKPVA